MIYDSRKFSNMREDTQKIFHMKDESASFHLVYRCWYIYGMCSSHCRVACAGRVSICQNKLSLARTAAAASISRRGYHSCQFAVVALPICWRLHNCISTATWCWRWCWCWCWWCRVWWVALFNVSRVFCCPVANRTNVVVVGAGAGAGAGAGVNVNDNDVMCVVRLVGRLACIPTSFIIGLLFYFFL